MRHESESGVKQGYLDFSVILSGPNGKCDSSHWAWTHTDVTITTISAIHPESQGEGSGGRAPLAW